MELIAAIEQAGYDGPIEAGTEIRILCPYHDDRNPSLDINANAGVFYCRSCQKGGTLIELIARLADSSLFLAAGLLIKSGYGKEASKRQPRDREQERARAKAFYDNLPHVNWTLERKITYPLDRGLYADTLHLAGAKLNRSSTHPLVFPVSEQGVFQGYVARSLDDRRDKYHNNPGFSKKALLEGDLRRGVVVVVEGFFDKWMVVQHGWANTTALFGSEVSEAWFAKLAKIATCVVNACDPDRSGRAAGEKLHSYGKTYAVPVRDFPFDGWNDDLGAMKEQTEFLNRFLGLFPEVQERGNTHGFISEQ